MKILPLFLLLAPLITHARVDIDLFAGKYDLVKARVSRACDCPSVLSIEASSDGDPVLCFVSGTGRRLALKNEEGVLLNTFRCIDQGSHGVMDDYFCNWVERVRSREPLFSDVIEVEKKSGRDCVYSPPKWRLIQKLVLKGSELQMSCEDRDDEVRTACTYQRQPK